MAGETKKYNCFLKEVTANTWTVTAGTALEAIGKRTPEPETPAASPALKATVAGKIAEGRFEIPALAVGERVIAVTMHIYCSSAFTENVKFGFTGALVATAKQTGTVASWFVVSASAATAETMTQKTLEEQVGFCESLKAKEALVTELYMSIETQTESARLVRQNGHLATTGPVGGGTVAVTVTAPSVGDTLLVAVGSAGAAGASAVSDSAGNAYVMDSEMHDGLVTNAQMWRAPITQAGATELKVTFPSSLAGAAVNIATAEFVPITTSSPVDTTGTSSGVGTNVEAASGALRAAQGDLAVGVFATTAVSATYTAENGAKLTGAAQAAGSLGWEYQAAPAEGTAITEKGTFSATGTWAGLVVAYKVLATTEAFSGTATVRAAGGLKVTGAKGVKGVGFLRAAGGVTATGAKNVSGQAAMSAGAHATASGAKASSGESAPRTAGGLKGTGSKAASGTSTVRSGAGNAGSGAKGVSGQPAMSAGAQNVATGAKGATGQPILRSAARQTAAGSKSTAGSASTRAGAFLTAASEVVNTGSAALSAAVRLLTTGQKAVTGSAAARAGARSQTVGFKAGTGSPTLRGASSQGAEGGKSASSTIQISAGAKLASIGSRLSSGFAALRAGGVLAAFEALQPPTPATLTVVSRSPTTLSSVSRCPTTLLAASRAPTTLEGGTP